MILAFGFAKTTEDIRLKLKRGSIYSNVFKHTYRDVYIIENIEEAINLYKRYEKTFRKKLKCRRDEFINECYIVKTLNDKNRGYD